MKFTDIFIERPVLAIVISALIFVLGLRAISELSIRQYPKTENAVVTVTTAFSVFGYCRIDSSPIARRPSTKISALITMARTGRSMKISVNFIRSLLPAGRSPPHCSCGCGLGLSAGRIELSTLIGAPLLSLICPLVTTSAPSSRPPVMAT